MEIFGFYDVVIVGGGTSGVAAAISSSRVGANTILI
jgi:flavin-dependent dehydrogenase